MYNYKDTPEEVLWVWCLPKTVGSDTYEKAERIVKKYPKYFPWEHKYESIPKEVHEAYWNEKYPDRNKPIECTGIGLKEQLKKSNSYKPITKEYFIKWCKDFTNIYQEELLNKKKDKDLWDKYYKKYNLEYRE